MATPTVTMKSTTGVCVKPICDSFIDAPRYASLRLAKRSISNGSRANALTTRMDSSDSWSTALTSAMRESDAVVVRRSSTEKRDTASATNGATAISTSVSFQFKYSIVAMEPTSVSAALTNNGIDDTPTTMRLTSLENRDMSSPLRHASNTCSGRYWMRSNSATRTRATTCWPTDVIV